MTKATMSHNVMNGAKATKNRTTYITRLQSTAGTGYWLLCFATGAHKPISWQVNSACTASLYLFLKGLFKIETERGERQIEEKG